MSAFMHEDPLEITLSWLRRRRNAAAQETDNDPDSYLELGEFADIADKRLIYVVDEVDLQKTRNAIVDPKKRSGIILGNELGRLQIELAFRLNCEAALRICAGVDTISYLVRGFRPTTLVAEYLLSRAKPVRD